MATCSRTSRSFVSLRRLLRVQPLVAPPSGTSVRDHHDDVPALILGTSYAVGPTHFSIQILLKSVHSGSGSANQKLLPFPSACTFLPPQCRILSDVTAIRGSAVHHRQLTTTTESNGTAEMSEEALRAEVDEINSKFAEARDEIEMALESMDTVYFNEEAEAARAAVKDVLDRFSSVLGRLDEGRKAALQRSMGLKMEQLKGELEQLSHEH